MEIQERIYVASKTYHGPLWKLFRDEFGIPIISTWIDECGIGETEDFADLWRRNIQESSSCTGLIVFGNKYEVLKGAMIEVGSALSHDIPVAMIGEIDAMKSAKNHSLVHCFNDLSEFNIARRLLWNTYIRIHGD